MTAEKAENSTTSIQHLLADFFGVNTKLFEKPDQLITKIKETITKYVDIIGQENDQKCFKCEPSIVVSENSLSFCIQSAHTHLILHAYYQQSFVSIDIFVSSSFDIEKVFTFFLDLFRPNVVRKTILSRGIVDSNH